MVASGLLLAFGPRVIEVEAAARVEQGAQPSDPLERAAGCPDGTFPDDGACIALPDDESFGEDPVGAPEGEVVANGHFDKSGLWRPYEQIPRRPERPADYQAYRYPIPPGLPGGRYVVSGYDLDLPDRMQRRGRMRAVGHGAVDLPQKRGTRIDMIALEHQVGPAEVVHVGWLMGLSVVTRHTLREGGRLRDYVLIFGHLEAPAEGLARGATLQAGETVGYVGDTGSPELVHLHLEARRVRDGITKEALIPGRILAPDVTIVCDPRNVLPLRDPG
jgi:murein DD-endopeptidase MepM/ murein hydrolase activator NlpD